MEQNMEKMKERIALFCEHPFFAERPAMIVAILDLEMRTGLKLPNSFQITMLPDYTVGRRNVVLGKVHTAYLFGMSYEDDFWEYKAFESHHALKLYFGQMEGLASEDLAFWITEIDKLPKR